MGAADPEIRIEPVGANEFEVVVDEDGSITKHRVTIQRETLDEWGIPAVDGEELLRISFEFLLAREPKESIMPAFGLRTIARYFPEYPKELRSRVSD